MTLPFNDDTHTRSYICFVCGIMYKNFEEFTEHIVETHEEGREYIKCPLQRCQACVRDLKQHFKTKHSGEKIPKVGPMRAIIWKDQSPAKGGKLKSKKPHFRQGYLISTKNGGKEMHYRSGMECDVYECLEAMKEVIAYQVEPFKVKYTFCKPGDTYDVHEYNPDLQVLFDDGHSEVWEVKPSDQTTLPVNQAKWTACKQHCEARGMGFMVLTEKGLGQLKQKIKNS